MSTVWSLFLTAVCLGEQPLEEPGAATPSTAIEDFTADAKQYVMRLDARPDARFELREEPLFHWSNPARLGEDGAVFVWMLQGRPQVIGSVFTYRSGDVIRRKHEYHSLASGPLTATYGGQRVWAPRQAGVYFESMTDAPPVPATARGRLSQLKALSRRFSAKIEDYAGKKEELRLLPQPLLRYESDDQTVDGALFSFSQGTDPEVILILEARLDGDAPTWQFAFARYHFVDLRVAYQGREVWHVDAMPKDITNLQIGAAKYQDSVYATYRTTVTPVNDQ
jgi:hypothetical protein